MAWDEWEQLKSQAAERQSTQMQLNQLDPGSGGGYTQDPSHFGDLAVSQGDLAKIGKNAFGLYNDLWNRGRRAVPTSETAAGTLSKDGFTLGGALKHVATRWDEQLSSLRDACAHISNHMTVTKKLHSGNDQYIRRQMSSIDLLDAGFDERVGEPGRKNSVYGESGEKKDEN
ncbi:hypothetical protein [Streptomyces chromofuscus]|uniref:AG1 protein n=1 Tax=Streptomyces chromofuscus TaxID=42881 RepID=A0A7M2T3Z8_STRCW|nr:hypothetical protein [Streptomyces chromofuscus]QOV43390.1 hypothetical protein IPT68_27175 [Streptomyces chromofuscus]GGT41684.1 hypothetical protein GCM10010254_71680 [Streptomyces chromofuscus]